MERRLQVSPVTVDFATIAGVAVAVIVCTAIIRLWRLHGGHDNLPGDVLWAGVTLLAIYGVAAQGAYRLDVAVDCAGATAVLWAAAIARDWRRRRRRSSLSRYYSN